MFTNKKIFTLFVLFLSTMFTHAVVFAACQKTQVNFHSFPLTGVSGQDIDTTGRTKIISDQSDGDGCNIELIGNRWLVSTQRFNITATSVLTFNFRSDVEGEVHGIGFDEDTTISANRIFKLSGTQNWGILDYANYTGGTKSYTIPIGQYYTGNNLRLMLSNDNDAGASGNNSVFSNVKITNQPRGVALSWKGYVDTNIQFSEFLGADHTIFARFMPQFPNAYEGPIFAENGSGNFGLYQGDFNSGNTRKLLLRVANQSQNFNVTMQAGVWQTVALVGDRQTSNTVYTLYFNGVAQTPTVTVSNTHAQLPAGTLRMGKRTTGQTVNNRNAQFYGLVDDLAVFTDDLTTATIGTYHSGAYQFTGSESNLLAAITFNDGETHTKLTRTRTLFGVSELPVVSPAHTSSYDRGGMALPRSHKKLHLPMKAGEPWYVIQGVDDPGGSHHGYASFCWDLMVDGQPQGGTYPNGTAGAPMMAAASGNVITLDDSLTSGQSPSNILEIQYAPEEIGGYLHLQQNSANVAVGNFALRGQDIADTGDVGASVGGDHIHYATTDKPDGDSGFVTFPVAFTDYEVKQSNGSWLYVDRGLPQKGEVIRKPLPDNLPYRVTAVFTPSSAGEIQMYGVTYTQFRARYDELWPQGWRLKSIRPHVRNNQVLYTAVWTPGTASETQVYGWTYTDFRNKYDELWPQGWRLHLLEPYVINNEVRYTAVWRASTSGETQVYGWTYEDFRTKYDELWPQGWRLHLIKPYVINGQVRYTAVWRPGTSGEIQVYGWTYTDFRNKYDELWPQGWRLDELETCVVNNQTRYTAVWRPGTGAERQVYDWSYQDFRVFYNDLWPDNWRLKLIDIQ